jgi:hypothetical protein
MSETKQPGDMKMRASSKVWVALIGIVASCIAIGPEVRLIAGPINPMVFKKKFEDSKKEAEAVAEVRVLSAVCTETAGEGKAKSVTLQLSLQVLESEKGPAKKNDVLVVTHKVNLPAGPGPGMYGYTAAVRQFPFTPGVKGSVALRWDMEKRQYAVIAGWVPEPNLDAAAIPKEVGKASVASDLTKK